MNKSELAKLIQSIGGLPPMMRVALSAGLNMLTQEQINTYWLLMIDAHRALSETERGRDVLARVGLPVAMVDGGRN